MSVVDVYWTHTNSKHMLRWHLQHRLKPEEESNNRCE